MKLQPLTTEVYNRLLEDGYTHFKLKHSYDRLDFGTGNPVTMLEAIKAEQLAGNENYLSREHVHQLLHSTDTNYCVMTT
ncbi:MAG: hypothetical protein JSS82_06240 [Bacteroidetes bacterium]|nr:hypothetical protein [Bacteroidota bacterium]